MRNAFLLLVALLIGCVTKGEDGPKTIGYGGARGCSGACGKATAFNGFQANEISRSQNDSDKMLIYFRVEELNKRPNYNDGPLFKAISGNTKIPLLDVGGQCLTVHQTGKDTVEVDGVRIVGDVAIEPCIPFLYDKDIE